MCRLRELLCERVDLLRERAPQLFLAEGTERLVGIGEIQVLGEAVVAQIAFCQAGAALEEEVCPRRRLRDAQEQLVQQDVLLEQGLVRDIEASREVIDNVFHRDRMKCAVDAV